MKQNQDANERMHRPLIMVTNDDGFESEGLWAVVEAVLPLGEVLVVAPDRQWSGAGRSMPYHVTGRVTSTVVQVDGLPVVAHAVDGSPALAVQHGVLELAPRRPALVVSGINFGYNLGGEVTISGTVGAALEAGAFGIPALAVSLEMGAAYHLSGDGTADYTAAKAFTCDLANRLLAGTLPADVHALSVNVPRDATPNTPWRVTHLSRCRYFSPTAPNRNNGQGRPGYRLLEATGQCEPGSDIYTVHVARMVSVTPLSLDLTSRVGLASLESYLHGDGRATSALLWTWQVPFEESIGVIAAGGSSQDLPGHPRTRAQHEPLAAGAVILG
jgi:5'-nucleotidase